MEIAALVCICHGIVEEQLAKKKTTTAIKGSSKQYIRMTGVFMEKSQCDCYYYASIIPAQSYEERQHWHQIFQTSQC